MFINIICCRFVVFSAPAILYNLLKPVFHPIHDSVKDVCVTNPKFFGILISSTVYNETDAGRIHGIVHHIDQTGDSLWFP